MKAYLRSFRPAKSLLWTLLIDTATVILLVLLITSFSTLLNAQTFQITGGQDIEQVKAQLLSGTEEESKQFLSNVKSLTYTLVFGAIVLFIILLLLFAFSRAYLWHILLKKRFQLKKAWRWLSLIGVLLLCLIPTLIIYGIIRFIANLFLFNASQYTYLIVTNGITFIFFLGYLLYAFLVFYYYTQKEDLWKTLSYATKQYPKMWKPLLLIAITGIFLSLFLTLIHQQFPLSNLIYLNAAISLLFLSWTRLYVVETL